MVLTMLSALARCGVDPWDEAARLGRLPRDAATKRLVSIISGLPRGQWAQSAVGDIAARLAALLPVEQAPASLAPPLAVGKAPKSAAMKTFFFVLILTNALLLHLPTQSRAVLSIRAGPGGRGFSKSTVVDFKIGQMLWASGR